MQLKGFLRSRSYLGYLEQWDNYRRRHPHDTCTGKHLRNPGEGEEWFSGAIRKNDIDLAIAILRLVRPGKQREYECGITRPHPSFRVNFFYKIFANLLR